MGVQIEQVTLAAQTSTGTQDFTFSGLGVSSSIKGAIFYYTPAVADDVVTDHAGIGCGFTAKGSQACGFVTRRDNVITKESFSRGYIDRVIMLGDESNQPNGHAIFDSFIEDGVRVDWIDAPAQGSLITCVLFSDDEFNMDCAVSNVTAISTPIIGGHATELLTQPQLILFMSVGHEFNGFRHGGGALSLGWASNNTDGVVSQVASVCGAVNGSTFPDEAYVYSKKNYVAATIGNASDSAQTRVIASNFESVDKTGRFNVITDIPGTELEVAYFAVTFNALRPTWTGLFNTPKTLGEEEELTPEFTPIFASWIMADVSSVNWHGDGQAGAWGVGSMTATSERSVSIYVEDGAVTSNTKSLTSSNAGKLLSDDGSANISSTASAERFTDNGFSLDFIVVNSARKTWTSVVIGEPYVNSSITAVAGTSALSLVLGTTSASTRGEIIASSSMSMTATVLKAAEAEMSGLTVMTLVDSTIGQGPQSFIGMNPDPISDFIPQWEFVDAMKGCRSWIKCRMNDWVFEYPDDPELDLDVNGWPILTEETVGADTFTQSVATLLFRSLDTHYPSGTYTVTYDGEGDLEFAFDATVVDSVPGLIHLNVVAADGGIYMKINYSNPADHVRNIRIMMPGFEGDTTTTFHPDFIDKMRDFGIARFMDWQEINNSTLTNWADRTTTTYYTQTNENGCAVEHMVELCNTLGCDGWFNIPHLATDDFITQWTTLIHETLNPGLSFYAEWSNEVWNSIFDQSIYARDQGCILWPELGCYPNGSNWFLGLTRYHGRRTREAHTLVAAAIAATGGERDLVRVMGGWVVTSFSNNALAFEDAYLTTDLLAIAPYMGGSFGSQNNAAQTLIDYYPTPPSPPPDAAGLIAAIDATLDDLFASVAIQKGYADSHGVILGAYEAGQHLVGVGAYQWDLDLRDLFIAANRHEDMGTLYTEYINRWSAIENIGPIVMFSLCQSFTNYGSFGVLEYLDQPIAETPKFAAIQASLGSSRGVVEASVTGTSSMSLRMSRYRIDTPAESRLRAASSLSLRTYRSPWFIRLATSGTSELSLTVVAERNTVAELGGTSGMSLQATRIRQIDGTTGRKFQGISILGLYAQATVLDIPDEEPEPPITTTAPLLATVDYVARWTASTNTLTVETADELTVLETFVGNISGGGTLGFLGRTRPSGGATDETYLRSDDGTPRVIRIIGKHQNAPFDGTRFRVWGAGSSSDSAVRIDNEIHLISFDSEGDDGGFLGPIDHANYYGGFEEVHYWNIYFWHDSAAGSVWCLSTNEDTSTPTGGEGTFHDPLGWIAIHSCTFNGTPVTNSENNIGRWYINGKMAASWLIEGVNTLGSVIKEHWAYLHYAQQAWIQNNSFGATGGTAIQFPNRHGRLTQPAATGGCASDFAYGNRFLPPAGTLGPFVVRDNLVDEGVIVPGDYFRSSFTWSFFGSFSPVWLMRNINRGRNKAFCIFTQDTPKGVWLTGPGVVEGVDWFATSGNSSLCGAIEEPEPGSPAADLPPGAYAFDSIYIEGNIIEDSDAQDREQMQINGVRESIIGANTIGSDRQTLILDKGGTDPGQMVNGTVCFTDRGFLKDNVGSISTYDPDHPEANTSGFYFFTLDELMAMVCDVLAPEMALVASAIMSLTTTANRSITAALVAESYIANIRMGKHTVPDPTASVAAALIAMSSMGLTVSYLPWEVAAPVVSTSLLDLQLKATRLVEANVIATSSLSAASTNLVGDPEAALTASSSMSLEVVRTRQISGALTSVSDLPVIYPRATSIKVATSLAIAYQRTHLAATAVHGVTASMAGTSSGSLITLMNRGVSADLVAISSMTLVPGVHTLLGEVAGAFVTASVITLDITSLNVSSASLVASSVLALMGTAEHVTAAALTSSSVVSLDGIYRRRVGAFSTVATSSMSMAVTATRGATAGVASTSSTSLTSVKIKIVSANVPGVTTLTIAMTKSRPELALTATSSLSLALTKIVALTNEGLGERLHQLEFNSIIKPNRRDFRELRFVYLSKYNTVTDSNEVQDKQIERLIQAFAACRGAIHDLETLLIGHSGNATEHNL